MGRAFLFPRPESEEIMKEEKITGLDYKLREMAGRIRELREVSGLSIEEVAQRTGLTVDEYVQCESGNRNLSIAFLYRCVGHADNDRVAHGDLRRGQLDVGLLARCGLDGVVLADI